MKIEIRKAQIEDIDLLTEWRMRVLREVFSIPQDKPQSGLERENRRYYTEALSAGNHIACFAYAGEKIAGCGGVCLYSEMPSPDNPNGKCAYLMNVYVLPEYRGRKIGKEIVIWLIRQAKNSEANKIYLESTDKGRCMYESLGFKSMENMMLLKSLGMASRMAETTTE